MANAKTVLTGLEVKGPLQVKGELNAPKVGGLLTGVSISKSANYELAAGEKTAYIGVTLTSASKTVTLGLPDGAVCLLVNEGGTNAFTAKNVAGDSGTSIAAGKAYVVRASTTANSSKFTLLNDGT